MQYTLFPEHFLQELQQTAGILDGPLRIAGQILQSAEFLEIKKSIEQDQRKLSEKRAAKRNREFKGIKSKEHLPVELVLALFIARHFYDNCFRLNYSGSAST